jgi:hypothetical protein
MIAEPGLKRPEIAFSWLRSEHSGLDPAEPRVRIAEVERSTRLTVAATPVIQEIAESLADHPFAVMLADERACIISARFGDRTIARQIERSGGVPGRIFNEELTGTSAIGTVAELRKPLAVHGEEHYLEALKDFSCYGAPIIHPITGRIVGLIDVTGFAKGATPILGPLLVRAARDIEARLLDLSRAAELDLFRRYQQRAAHRSAPLIALWPAFVMANTAATDSVSPADYALLRSIGGSLGSGRALNVRLVSGAEVCVRSESIGARGEYLLVEVDLDAARPSRGGALVSPSSSAERRTRGSRWVIIGEAGTGRTTEAVRLAGPTAVRHSADIALEAGDAHWLRDVALSLRSGPCVIDDVDVLSPRAAARLARLLAQTTNTVALTCGVRTSPSTEHAALLASGGERTTLRPLRERLDDLPEMVRRMTGGTCELAASALESLTAHDWPGNLHELNSVIGQAVKGTHSNRLTVHDLPIGYRRTVRARQLSRLEIAERDTVVAALAETGGNIVRTARVLGISRPTLYSRIRILGIAR